MHYRYGCTCISASVVYHDHVYSFYEPIYINFVAFLGGFWSVFLLEYTVLFYIKSNGKRHYVKFNHFRLISNVAGTLSVQ